MAFQCKHSYKECLFTFFSPEISKQNKKAARKKRIKKGLCVGFIRGIYIVERRISAEFPQRVS